MCRTSLNLNGSRNKTGQLLFWIIPAILLIFITCAAVPPKQMHCIALLMLTVGFQALTVIKQRAVVTVASVGRDMPTAGIENRARWYYHGIKE